MLARTSAVVLLVFALALVRISANGHIAVATPAPRCDSQGYFGVSQVFAEMPQLQPRSQHDSVVTSINRVMMNGRAIAYIYNLKDRHHYFSRKAGIRLTPSEKTALITLLKHVNSLGLKPEQLRMVVAEQLNPAYTPIHEARNAAADAGLSITHCL